MRGGSLSQFYGQNGCESAFAVLWLQLMVAFAAFAVLSRNFASALSHAFAHAFAHTFAARARFGAYLRSICVSEAEAWTYESSDCSLHPHGTIGSPEHDRSHLCHNNVSHRVLRSKDLRCAPTEIFSDLENLTFKLASETLRM